MEHDGNGWVHCGLGHRHWGRHGAAGLLLRNRRRTLSEPTVLLQHRAAWTADGDTWGVPGGARDSHESTVEAALREAYEETGIEPGVVEVFDEFTDDHGDGWAYTTVLADLIADAVLVPQHESVELRWVGVTAVSALPLHPGFQHTWPELRTRMLHVPPAGGDARLSTGRPGL